MRKRLARADRSWADIGAEHKIHPGLLAFLYNTFEAPGRGHDDAFTHAITRGESGILVGILVESNTYGSQLDLIVRRLFGEGCTWEVPHGRYSTPRTVRLVFRMRGGKA